jgi:hypothetical protein
MTNCLIKNSNSTVTEIIYENKHLIVYKHIKYGCLCERAYWHPRAGIYPSGIAETYYIPEGQLRTDV